MDTEEIQSQEEVAQELDTLENKPSWGGVREGGGRPKGSKNKATIESKIIEEEFKDRILLNIQELLTSQMNIAKGASYLFRIDEEKSSKGTVLQKHHVLVEDPNEILAFLDELEGGSGVVDDNYYYITTRAPDNRALDSLIDRVFGRPANKTDLTIELKPTPLLDAIRTKTDESGPQG